MPGFNPFDVTTKRVLKKLGGDKDTKTLTYDGNREGVDIFDDGNLFVKISDKYVDLENVISFTFVAANGEHITVSDPDVTREGTVQCFAVGTNSSGTLLIAVLSVPPIEAAEGYTGLYVMDNPEVGYVSSLTFENVTPIDPKYLLDTVIDMTKFKCLDGDVERTFNDVMAGMLQASLAAGGEIQNKIVTDAGGALKKAATEMKPSQMRTLVGDDYVESPVTHAFDTSGCSQLATTCIVVSPDVGIIEVVTIVTFDTATTFTGIYLRASQIEAV